MKISTLRWVNHRPVPRTTKIEKACHFIKGEKISVLDTQHDVFIVPHQSDRNRNKTEVAEKGDTLVSVRAPVGDVNMANEKCCVGRGLASLRHKTGSRSYTYYTMQSLQEVFSRYEAEGTVFGSINKTDFQTLSQLSPPNEIIEAFERLIFPLDQSVENNENESRTLAQTRDTLLPKLLSGEIRVDEISEVKDDGKS